MRAPGRLRELLVADRVQQVRLAEADAAADEHRVVFRRVARRGGLRRGERELVRRAGDERVERVARVERRRFEARSSPSPLFTTTIAGGGLGGVASTARIEPEPRATTELLDSGIAASAGTAIGIGGGSEVSLSVSNSMRDLVPELAELVSPSASMKFDSNHSRT